MSQPTIRTTISTASRQEALALANAARKLTKFLPAIEDSSEALAAILRQHTSSLVLQHDELSHLAKHLELPQQQLVHNMQAVATALEASAASEDTVTTQQHTCCVLSKALAFYTSMWKCKASTAAVAKCMLAVMKGIAEPLQGEMHLAMQQLVYTMLQHMSSSPTCAADHNCLPLAQASLLKAISFAIGSFPDLQQRSWDMGESAQHICTFTVLLFNESSTCLAQLHTKHPVACISVHAHMLAPVDIGHNMMTGLQLAIGLEQMALAIDH